MKKLLICILAIFAFLLSGCGQQEAPAAETEPDREIDICLTDYYGMISVLEEDMDGNSVPGEYGSISVLGAPGEQLLDRFTDSGYSVITPVLEGDSFEGWMECRYDEDLGNYVIVSETLYSTAELMSMPVPEAPVEYVAKWAGIPMEEYFESDPFEGASSGGVFSLSGNGGSLHFLDYSNEEYTCTSYTYSLEDGQALSTVMGTEYGDSLIGITKDGAQFTGWTVYMADDLFFSTDPAGEEDMLCLVYDENSYDGVLYAMLRNATLVDGNMSTEQLCGMTCYGENYLAVANWESAPNAAGADQADTSIFAFSGNGGSIHFQSYDGEQDKTVAYAYTLAYGQALNDVMGTEYGDALIDITKDGAEFLGWTVYMADEITWSNEEIYDTQILCLPYNDSGSQGMQYAHLKNGTLLGEYMPTEQLCGMTCYGENYLALAIWSE